MTPEDEIAIIKWTVLLEAAGEPFAGKLAVAHVIRNRMAQRGKTAFEICWAPYQFSAWLMPLKTIAEKLSNESLTTIADCNRAAKRAYDRSGTDPTLGATHYLNEALTIAQSGKLPSWVEQLQWTVKIGQHDFYK